MNFITTECTFLRYFLPLTIEGNKRNIKSNYFIGTSGKYNCPNKYTKQINDLSLTYNFNTFSIEEIKNHSGLTFMIEGIGTNYLNNTHKKATLTYMTDFVFNYSNFESKVDNVIFPGEFIPKHYNITNSIKNLYLGSPKYDVKLDRHSLLKKYNLENKKYILIIYPRERDINKINLTKLYNILQELGYTIIVKSRGKDPIQYKGDYNFYDTSWFPHDSMELITISDVVINFSSTVIKELVLLKKPCINFNIKPFGLIFPFLYDKNTVTLNPDDFTKEDINKSINELKQYNNYDDLIEKYLFKPGEVSKQILDKLI